MNSISYWEQNNRFKNLRTPKGVLFPFKIQKLKIFIAFYLYLMYHLDMYLKGIIFLTNCVMGIGLPSEYWLREWIEK